MLKKNKWNLILSSIVIVLPILFGLVYWKELPAGMTSHWGVAGEADGWSGRIFSVLGLPGILLAMHWLGIFITAKDPKNQEQNSKVFGLILWICPVLSLVTNSFLYSVALEKEMKIEYWFLLVFGLFWIVVGNYMPKCKQNFSIGIRVRWTLANEENWFATHRFAGKIWVTGGLLCMFCILLPMDWVIWGLIPVFVAMAVVPFVYSYLYYKKQVAAGTADEKAVIPMGKQNKNAQRIGLAITGIIVVVVLFFVLSANFRVEYGDMSFTVDCSGWSDITVAYASIESVEFRQTHVAGKRIYGFGDVPLQMGTFRNSEFGNYTRYTHSGCNAAVIIKVDGKVLVLNGKDEESTQRIYETLLAKQS